MEFADRIRRELPAAERQALSDAVEQVGDFLVDLVEGTSSPERKRALQSAGGDLLISGAAGIGWPTGEMASAPTAAPVMNGPDG